MKKKNGFTLIELLAIIVILAIIAVITVPIILNIIENSKRGAVTDSAYGYKDAVNKWYVSKLQEDSGYTLNGNYNVSDGKLNNIEIPLSGDKPTGGNLHYTNNVLDGGCLTIGDYKVTFDSNGSVSSTEKGSCDSSNIVLSCADDEYLYEINQYVVTDQQVCETGLVDKGIAPEEIASQLCSGEEVEGLSLSGAINLGYFNYSDVESFVSYQTIDSWCRPKSEECFEFSDNGDWTATLSKYLCGAELNEDTGAYITEGKILDVNIPSQITGKNGKLAVTAIGNDVFWGNQLTSVTIPNSVKTIGNGAFSSNQLTSVTIPVGITAIGDAAFSDNKLTSVTIPNSVTTIGEAAFSRNQLTSVTIPVGITTIGDGAFSINLLTNVTIPNSVTTIGESAFEYNSLKNVVLGNNITMIGKKAFEIKSNTTLTLDNKTYYANPSLSMIYNNTGRSFNWQDIVGSSSSATFETGTINHSVGNITVTTGYPSDN